MIPVLSSPLLMDLIFQMGASFLNMLGTGSSGSGFKLPLGNSGISLSVSTGTEPGGHTITLHFSGLGPAQAALLQQHLVAGAAEVSSANA